MSAEASRPTFREGGGETLERRAGRAGDRDAPPLAGFPDAASLQGRDQARTDQRRLTAARYPDYGNEAVALQAADQLRDLRVAPEEEVDSWVSNGRSPG